MTIDCDKTLGSTLQSMFSCREFDEDSGFTSSKVLLTAPFSELRTESGSFIHSVQLVLTTDGEIVVLKRPTDKFHRYSFLRRHKLCQTEFKMHNLWVNSFTAIVPDTILRYTYQVYGSGSSIGEWLLKIVQCRVSKDKSTKEKSSTSPKRAHTSTAGQTTNYQSTDETVQTNTYSSPTHPIQRQLPSHPHTSTTEQVQVPSHPHPPTTEQVPHPLMNTQQTIVQMPNGLIKARSFQERGSVKQHFVRPASSSSDLDKKGSVSEDFSCESTTSTPFPPSQSRTPSPITDDVNPFESRLRHTQVRNKKRIVSPRISRPGSTTTNPTIEELRDKRYYSRSANSTPVPGLTSSLVIASPSALASDMAGSSYTQGSSGTLPRSKKGKKERYVSVAESTNGTSPNKTPGKSPRLLRMWHRRWQSSSAIKVPFTIDGDEQSTSAESAPRKLHQFSPKEVAEELSLMDAELLRKIGPEELQNGAWMKKDQKDKLAPNIMAMVRSFNQLALLIPSEILDEKTPQGRAKIITTYIQIAAKLYSSRNYNSLKAVLAGLQSTPIYRLKKTWKEVPSKKRKRFEQLCALMSEIDNWQLYRSEIDRKLTSGSSFIPFLGQFLTQVVQTDTYNQAREDRKASLSPSETPSKSLPVPLLRPRTRSSSLGDTAVHSTSSPAHTEPSSEEPSTCSLTVEDITISVSAPVSPVHQGFKSPLEKKDSSASSQSTDSGKDRSHSKSPSFDSNCVSPPLSVNGSDEDEVDGHDDNGSHTTDSGHHSCSGSEFRLPPSIPKSSSHATLCVGTAMDSPDRSSQLELSQIYVSLQRHSQSYETLLNTYTKEDLGLRNVLHTTLNELTRLSASLQSLDSVFSDDDEEESPHLTSSLNTTCPPDFDSDIDRTSDYGSDLPTESPKVEGSRRPRRILFHAVSDNTQKVCALTPDGDQCSPEQQVDDVEFKDSNNKKKLQRSKSYHADSKLTKRRRYRRKSRKTKEDKVDVEQPKTPAEILNRFQVASLGCSMGVKENGELRCAICGVEPHSESVSFKLSVEREGREVK